jgi:hypothetical protein
MLTEHPFNFFGGKYVGKRQSWVCQESVDKALKSAAASVGRIGYPAHEKTLLGFAWEQTAKEGLNNLAEDGPKSKSNLQLPENYKILRSASTVGARPTPRETADSAIRGRSNFERRLT